MSEGRRRSRCAPAAASAQCDPRRRAGPRPAGEKRNGLAHGASRRPGRASACPPQHRRARRQRHPHPLVRAARRFDRAAPTASLADDIFKISSPSTIEVRQYDNIQIIDLHANIWVISRPHPFGKLKCRVELKPVIYFLGQKARHEDDAAGEIHDDVEERVPTSQPGKKPTMATLMTPMPMPSRLDDRYAVTARKLSDGPRIRSCGDEHTYNDKKTKKSSNNFNENTCENEIEHLTCG